MGDYLRAPSLAFTGLFALITGVAQGESGDGQAIETPEIIEVVDEASPEAQLRVRESGTVEVIEVGHDEAGQTLSQVLSQGAGIQIQSLGGMGQFAQVNIRGSSAEQVAIYIDGVPVNRAVGGAVNLSDFSLAQVERIEVYRGKAGTSLPGMPAGGAINIITRKDGGRGGDLSLTLGRYQTLGLQGGLRHGGEVLRASLMGEYLSSEGQFTYLDDNGTPENADDDQVVERINNDFSQGSLHGRVQAFGLSLDGDYFQAERGVPGLGSIQSETARFAVRRMAFNLSTRDYVLSPSTQITGGVDYRQMHERFSDPDGSVGVGQRDQEGVTQSLGLRVGVRHSRNGAIHHHFSLAPRHERYQQFAYYPQYEALGQFERTLLNGQYALDWGLNGGRLFLNPDIRYQFIDDRNDGADRIEQRHLFTASQGARLLLPRRTLLKGAFFGGYRAPSFYELYGDRGAIVGNPDLVPEGVMGVEGAYAQNLSPWGGALFVEVSAFHKWARDLIQYVQNSQKTSHAINISGAHLSGAEGRFTFERQAFEVAGHLAYLRAIDRSDIPHYAGNALPRRPRFDAHLGLSYGAKSWAKMRVDLNYISPTYLDLANYKRTQSRMIVGARLSGQWAWDGARDWAAGRGDAGGYYALRLENLLAQQVPDFEGYPLPGRGVFLEVGYGF